MAKVYYPQARVFLTITLDDFTQTPAVDKDRQSLWLVPESVNVVKNSSSQADSFTITLATEDFPFLPSQIIGGQAEIYLFQTDGFDAAGRVLGREDAEPIAGPQKATSSGLDINDVRNTSNWPVIVGTFDDVEVEYSDSGRSVTISGQDYTAYLLGRQWPPTEKGGPRRVKTPGPRIDIWLQDVLNEADPELKLQVALSGVLAEDLPKIGGGLAVKKNGIAIDQGTKYWDVISKVCWLHGFSVYVDGTFVVLLARKAPKEKPRTDVYTLSWKENVTAIRTSRKMGKEKAPQVIVQSYDPVTKKVVYGEHPPGANVRRLAKKRDKDQDIVVKAQDAKKPTRKPRGVTQKSSEEYEVLPANAPISDKRTLDRMAKDRYELIARGELKMTVRTSDLRDTQKRANVPGHIGEQDLLKLKSGDIMFVEFDPFDMDRISGVDPTDASKIVEVTEAQRYEYLKAQGYSLDMSSFLATHYNLVDQLRRPFIVSEVQFDYSVSDGIDIEIQLVEAINADPDPDATTETRRAGRHPGVKKVPRTRPVIGEIEIE